jgi:hypothetical protein
VIAVFDGSVHSDFGTIGTVTTRGSSSTTSTAVAAGVPPTRTSSSSTRRRSSETSCTVLGATAIENLLPAAGIAGATYVGWYDTSGGTSTITATYGAVLGQRMRLPDPADARAGALSGGSHRSPSAARRATRVRVGAR